MYRLATVLESLQNRVLLSGDSLAGTDWLSLGEVAESEPNDSPETADFLASSAHVAGTIRAAGDRDFFSVSLTASVLLSVRVAASDPIDVRLSLFDDRGHLLLTSDSDRLASQAAQVESHFGLGQLTLRVESTGDAVGNYDLWLDSKPAGRSLEQPFQGDTPAALVMADFNGDEIVDVAIANSFSNDVSVLLGVGDGTFSAEQRIAVGDYPERLTSADFNGDGWTDLATGNSDSDDVSILLGRGDGTFHDESRYAMGSFIAQLLVPDLNQDGVSDLVAINIFVEAVSVRLGNGDGTFQDEQQFAVGVDSHQGVAQDFNHDGFIDLAVVNSGSNDVSVLLGRGDGTFADERRLAVGDNPRELASLDLNGDGQLDLVTVNQFSGDVSVLIGDGHGGFGNSHRFAAGSLPRNLLVEDFDGDGRKDVGTLNSFNGFAILRGQGDGTFSPPLEADVGRFPQIVRTADYNRDGRLDLISADERSGDVSVFLQSLDGTFLGQQQLRVAGTPVELTNADVNRDGKLDILAVNSSPSRVAVSLGIGDGSFLAQEALKVGSGPLGFVSGDFNRDGHPDLATARAGVSVLLGRGDGTYSPETWYAAGRDLSQLLSVDVNADGRLDLAALDEFGDSVWVLLGIGDGTFAEAQQFTVGEFPSTLLSADFNGDGRPDLATGNGRSRDVSILLESGNGSFRVQPPIPVDDFPYQLLAGDFNNDGVTDLVSGAFFSDDDSERGSLTVLVGNGDGTFTAVPRIAIADHFNQLRAADINADGHSDLLLTLNVGIAFDQQGFLAVLLGRGDGTFDAEQRFVANSELRQFVTADVNADGKLDVIAAGFTEDFVSVTHVLSVFVGDGDGTFAAVRELPLDSTNGSNKQLHVADLDGDSRPDLVLVNVDDNSLSVLLGNGDGTFANEFKFAVGVGPTSLVISDLTGDGQLDLATANFNSGDVSVLVNVLNSDSATPSLGFLSGLDLSPNQFNGDPVLFDFDHDFTLDLLLINRAGEILFRKGRATDPTTFDAPLRVNPAERSTRAIIPVNGRLAAINLNDSVSIYAAAVAGGFREAERLTAGEFPTRLSASDLNNDGREDLVVTNVGSRDVSVFLAQPDGTFSTTERVPVGPSPSALQLVDIDQSGSIDILVANSVSGDVSVLFNQGDATFAAARFRAGTGFFTTDNDTNGTFIRSFERTSALTEGDFNEDGRSDLIVANPGEHGFTILFGSPLGGFLNPSRDDTALTGTHPAFLRMADFNRDGHADFALLNDDSHEIWIQLGDGHGQFVRVQSIDTGSIPTGLSIVDLTGPQRQSDGFLDVLVANEFGDVLTLQGHGDGTFSAPTRTEQNVPLVVSDLDGDGRLDYVLANQARDRVVLQSSRSGAKPLPKNTQEPLLAPGAVQLADLNADHILDLIVANTGSNNVLVYRGLAGGQFLSPDAYLVGTSPTGLTIADVTGDGRLDVIVANSGSNDVSILRSQVNTASNWVTFAAGPRLDLGEGSGPVSTSVVDQNRDGTLDLLVTNAQAGTLALLPGTGGGFFNDQNFGTFNIGNTTVQGGTVVSNQFFAVNPLSNTVTFISDLPSFLNSHDSSLMHSFATGGDGATSLLPFDLNGDSLLDLLVANAADGSVALLLRDGNDFTLDRLLQDSSLLHPNALALARVDDRLELYVTDAGEEIATIFDLEVAVAENSDSAIPGRDSRDQLVGLRGAASLLTTIFGTLNRGTVEDRFQSPEVSATEFKESLQEFFSQLLEVRDPDVLQELSSLVSTWWEGLRLRPRESAELLTEEFAIRVTSDFLAELGIPANRPEWQTQLRAIVTPLIRLQVSRTTWVRWLDQAGRLWPSTNGAHRKSVPGQPTSQTSPAEHVDRDEQSAIQRIFSEFATTDDQLDLLKIRNRDDVIVTKSRLTLAGADGARSFVSLSPLLASVLVAERFEFSRPAKPDRDARRTWRKFRTIGKDQ